MSHTARATFARYGSAASRLLTVFCAFAFLFVGITHTLSHYEAPTIAFELQVGDSPDDATDNSKSTAVHHCCGCAAVALPVIGGFTVAGLVSTKLTFPPTAHVLGHVPTFATPPPKS